jgi:hypothetical protein
MHRCGECRIAVKCTWSASLSHGISDSSKREILGDTKFPGKEAPD